MKTRTKLLFIVACFSTCFFATSCNDDQLDAPTEVLEIAAPPTSGELDGAPIEIPEKGSVSNTTSSEDEDEDGAPIEIPEKK